jgi:hypothetical protein
MSEVEAELRDLRESLLRTQARLRRLTLGLAGGAACLLAGVAIFTSRVAHSDPSTSTACGHSSQLYCFQPGAPALAAQVNSNFEATYEAVDGKFDKTGGTVTGNLDVTGTATANTVSATNLTSTTATVTNTLSVNQSLTTASLVVGTSTDQPIARITTCRVSPTGVAGNNQYYFQGGDCSKGLPSGTCEGWLSRWVGCGIFTQPSLYMPQETAGNPYIYWYNQSECGNPSFVATFVCSQ